MEQSVLASRKSNTTCTGEPFDEQTVEAVWNKGGVIPGYHPDYFRRDACGAAMLKTAYGIMGDFGWEIDHIRPVAKDGTDDLDNLQPMHWRNNRKKGDDSPHWACAVISP